MIGIEERLRHNLAVLPNRTVDIYPEEVIELIDELRAELVAARVELADRENDLRYEYLRRVEAEDTIDRIKQALHIAAAGVSSVDTAEQMYAELTTASAELERLRTAAQGFANVAMRYAPTSTGRAWHEAWDALMDALEV